MYVYCTHALMYVHNHSQQCPLSRKWVGPRPASVGNQTLVVQPVSSYSTDQDTPTQNIKFIFCRYILMKISHNLFTFFANSIKCNL